MKLCFVIRLHGCRAGVLLFLFSVLISHYNLQSPWSTSSWSNPFSARCYYRRYHHLLYGCESLHCNVGLRGPLHFFREYCCVRHPSHISSSRSCRPHSLQLAKEYEGEAVLINTDSLIRGSYKQGEQAHPRSKLRRKQATKSSFHKKYLAVNFSLSTSRSE